MKTKTWNDLVNEINQWMDEHHQRVNLFKEGAFNLEISNITFIDTAKFKRLQKGKKDHYLASFVKGGWQIDSIMLAHETLLIVWEKSFQKRGWKLTLDNASNVSISEYELI